jgi:membrane protein
LILKILSRLPLRLRQADVPLLAASMAFSTLLSLIPFFAIGFAVMHFFGGTEIIRLYLQEHLVVLLSQTAGQDVSFAINRILIRISKLSWAATSAIALVISSVRLFFNLETAVNRIWSARKQRSFLQRLYVVGGLYVIFPFALAVYVGFRSSEALKPIFLFNPMLFDISVLYSVLLLMNKYIPTPHVLWKTAGLGAGLSLGCLYFLQEIFSWFTLRVFNYSKVYGSLAALPLLCLLVLMTWQAIFAGFALASALQSSAKASERNVR